MSVLPQNSTYKYLLSLSSEFIEKGLWNTIPLPPGNAVYEFFILKANFASVEEIVSVPSMK